MEAKEPGQRRTVGPAAASHAIMAGHPAEHAQQDATLRTMALGTLILNAFSVRAAPGRFMRCRCSAIQNNVQTNTYDPQRPRATPSLLFCRQSQTLVGALILAVVMSGVVDCGRKSGHGKMTQFGPIEIEKALNLDGTEGLRRAPLRP